MYKILVVLAILACGYVRAMDDVLEILVKHSRDFMKNGTECKAQVGATDMDVAIFMSKKLPDTKTGDCMIACMMEKLGGMVDGKFIEDSPRIIAHSILGPEDAIADLIGDVGKACSKEVESVDEKCAMARKIAECGLDHVKKFKDATKN